MAFEDLKQRQSVMWSSGPYEPIVRVTAEIHTRLVDALEPQPGERVLDVATGTGAVALLAAEAGAVVAGVDFARDLVERARDKAEIWGLDIEFEVGDAEALPYEDDSFDVVCSSFGTQFAPDHAAVARELARVCRSGGRLGLACWTPTSGVADLFAVMRPFSPPPVAGVGDLFDWGRPEYVRELLGADFELTIDVLDSPLYAPSGEDVWQRFVTAFGPTRTLAASLEPDRLSELHDAWVTLLERCRRNDEIVQSRTYLLITGTRR
jgi:SAM-dependent methyltransferase